MQALQLIQAETSRTPVDVVLYIDRLDFYRVEPVDEAVSCLLACNVCSVSGAQCRCNA